MTTAIDRIMISPDELHTPRISPMEGITALRDKLERVKHDVSQLCRLMESTRFLSEGHEHVTKAPTGHYLSRDTSEANWDTEEEASSSLWEEAALTRSPSDTAAGLTLSQQLAAGNGAERDVDRLGDEEQIGVRPTPSVDQVPVEIWMYIFELCAGADRADSPDDAAGFNVPQVGRVPLVLCRVSRFWKRLAMTTPSLWTSFSLTLEKTPPSIGDLKSSMELWLRCSRSMDLAVNLELDPAAVAVFSNHLLDHVAVMLKRCHKLRINVPDEVLCAVLRMGLPKLRTLEIRTSHIHKEVPSLDVRAPELRTLVVLGPSMCRFSESSLPWAQLTEYKGCCWADMQRHLDIVRMSPNLERCTLHPFYELRGGGTGVLPLRVEKLRRLQVVSYLGPTVGGFLRYLEAPAIESLTLEISSESPAFSHTGWPRGQIVDFLERSDGHLKRLELVGMEVEGGEIGQALKEHCRLSSSSIAVQL